jgi:hypothetical protein
MVSLSLTFATICCKRWIEGEQQHAVTVGVVFIHDRPVGKFKFQKWQVLKKTYDIWGWPEICTGTKTEPFFNELWGPCRWVSARKKILNSGPTMTGIGFKCHPLEGQGMGEQVVLP